MRLTLRFVSLRLLSGLIVCSNRQGIRRRSGALAPLFLLVIGKLVVNRRYKATDKSVIEIAFPKNRGGWLVVECMIQNE